MNLMFSSERLISHKLFVKVPDLRVIYISLYTYTLICDRMRYTWAKGTYIHAYTYQQESRGKVPI